MLATSWLTCNKLTTPYYVLFFDIRLDTRQVHIAGATPPPRELWLQQIVRNVTMDEWGFLQAGQYLIHDRAGKFCPAFTRMVEDTGVPCIPLPPKSPNLNVSAERWIRSVQEAALSKVIRFGERSLWNVRNEYMALSRRTAPSRERQRQPVANRPHEENGQRPIDCRKRLGGLLQYYDREAA